MDIFPKLIGEKEFLNFTDEDYAALSAVLDDVTAKYICDYCDNPNADKALVEKIRSHMQETLTSLTFHIELKNNGTVELVKSLSPESLPYADVDLNELIAKLSYLEANQDNIKSTIPGRTREAYERFVASMDMLVSRMKMDGIIPTYPDMVKRIQANKFLFYQSGEKEHTTGIGILNNKKRQWILALNGARWIQYCTEKGLSHSQRSAF